jgi:hypothetical protein
MDTARQAIHSLARTTSFDTAQDRQSNSAIALAL